MRRHVANPYWLPGAQLLNGHKLVRLAPKVLDTRELFGWRLQIPPPPIGERRVWRVFAQNHA
eukprot:8763685-Lingulodinium_polyedra.AAC.1